MSVPQTPGGTSMDTRFGRLLLFLCIVAFMSSFCIVNYKIVRQGHNESDPAHVTSAVQGNATAKVEHRTTGREGELPSFVRRLDSDFRFIRGVAGVEVQDDGRRLASSISKLWRWVAPLTPGPHVARIRINSVPIKCELSEVTIDIVLEPGSRVVKRLVRKATGGLFEFDQDVVFVAWQSELEMVLNVRADAPAPLAEESGMAFKAGGSLTVNPLGEGDRLVPGGAKYVLQNVKASGKGQWYLEVVHGGVRRADWIEVSENGALSFPNGPFDLRASVSSFGSSEPVFHVTDPPSGVYPPTVPGPFLGKDRCVVTRRDSSAVGFCRQDGRFMGELVLSQPSYDLVLCLDRSDATIPSGGGNFTFLEGEFLAPNAPAVIHYRLEEGQFASRDPEFRFPIPPDAVAFTCAVTWNRSTIPTDRIAVGKFVAADLSGHESKDRARPAGPITLESGDRLPMRVGRVLAWIDRGSD